MQRALVLSAGGAKGSWQVGACKHLIGERGVWFDVISGVSVGAVNGTTLAHAHDLNGMKAHLERLRSVWFGVRGNENIYRRRRHGALGMALGRWHGLYDVTPLREEVLGREIHPEQVATSPVRLKVGYVDLRSRRYRIAGNDHPSIRDAVLASCALPVLFPPTLLAGGREIGVDGGIRHFAPLSDAFRGLAELPPDGESPEVWVMMVRGPGKTAPGTMVQKWLQVAFPSFAIRADDANDSETVHTFSVSGGVLGRNHDVRLRVLHPAEELPGWFLDFDPTNIRRWYEDGLRTAQGAEEMVLNGNGHAA